MPFFPKGVALGILTFSLVKIIPLVVRSADQSRNEVIQTRLIFTTSFLGGARRVAPDGFHFGGPWDRREKQTLKKKPPEDLSARKGHQYV